MSDSQQSLLTALACGLPDQPGDKGRGSYPRFREKRTQVRGEGYLVQGHRADYQNPEPLVSHLLPFLLLPDPITFLGVRVIKGLTLPRKDPFGITRKWCSPSPGPL